jgi:hypothetical protein
MCSSTTVAGGELQRRLQRRTEAAVQLLGKDPYAALASRREVSGCKKMKRKKPVCRLRQFPHLTQLNLSGQS